MAKVKISLKGKIVSESGDDGFFRVRVAKPEKRIPLTFATEGYVPNTRIFDATASGINGVAIWPRAYRIKFDPTRDLDIELGHSRIGIPANAVVEAGGKKLTKPAQLSFTLFDVTNPRERAGASGDFTGRFEDGRLQRLNSYGIFNLDVEADGSRQLNLRSDAEIELAIALPRTLVRRAPKQVGYFTFDPNDGLWIHAGSFSFVPGSLTYNGTITGFGGAHNLDNPQLTTCVTVQVVNLYDGSGLAGMNVVVQGGQYASTGVTDANGFVCLIVDRNAPFSVTAQGTPTGLAGFWATPNPVTLVSPNIASGASNCGDPNLCPFVGTLQADFVVGRAAFAYLQA